MSRRQYDDADYEDLDDADGAAGPPVRRLSAEESAQLQQRLAGMNSANSPWAGIMRNPDALKQMFSLSDDQAAHVRSLLAGLGTSLGVEALSKFLGTPIAGALGGLFGGIMADKVFKPTDRRGSGGWPW